MTIFRGFIALFGIDDLNTDKCEPPCQMRIVNKVKSTKFNWNTFDNDLSVVTIFPPLELSDEVSTTAWNEVGIIN